MKRLICFILVMTMLLSLAACVGKTENAAENTADISEENSVDKKENISETDSNELSDSSVSDSVTDNTDTDDYDEIVNNESEVNKDSSEFPAEEQISDINEQENVESTITSQLVTEGTVAVTSLDELKLYADAKLVTQDLFDYLSAFLAGGWEYPEVNDLTEISDYSISFTIPFDNVTGFDVYFTVSDSTLPTLPTGKYHRVFSDGVYFSAITDPDEVRDTRFSDIAEVDKLQRFIGVNRIWNTPVFGEGKTFPGVYDYIHCYYGDVKDYFRLDYEELCRIAREEFGVSDTSQLCVRNEKLDGDRLLTLDSIYYPPKYKIEDVQKNAEGTFITVRFYADYERLIYSHKILYYFDEKGRFNGYEVIEQSPYEPWGLSYCEDN